MLSDPNTRSFDESWVTIATFRDLTEAEMARVTIDAEGIPCFLADAEVIRLDWTLSTALGGIKLRVPATERERALERLHRTSTAQVLALADSSVQDREESCPACGESAILGVDRGRRFSLVAILLGLPLFFRWRSSRCAACGHRWKSRE
jgi:predicted RNA-binding Zn-ribbon protein involved in translation (DUF1610 family)